MIYFTVLLQAIIGMHSGSMLMAVTFDVLKQPSILRFARFFVSCLCCFALYHRIV